MCHVSDGTTVIDWKYKSKCYKPRMAQNKWWVCSGKFGIFFPRQQNSRIRNLAWILSFILTVCGFEAMCPQIQLLPVGLDCILRLCIANGEMRCCCAEACVPSNPICLVLILLPKLLGSLPKKKEEKLLPKPVSQRFPPLFSLLVYNLRVLNI